MVKGQTSKAAEITEQDSPRLPVDDEPPFFRGCTEEENRNQWTKNPLRMEVGNVNSKHFVLALKVKSVLDPCEDENAENQDESVSLGADSFHKDDSSDSGSEVSSSQEDQFIVAPVDKERQCQNDSMASEDEKDEYHSTRAKGWISSNQLESVKVTDVLANFPHISVVLIKDIVEKLVSEGFLSKAGKDTYAVIKAKELEYEFIVKEEEQDQVLQH